MDRRFSEFRPSSIERFLACSLWHFLPKTTSDTESSKVSKEKGRLEHERLEAEGFKESEAECSAYYHSVKRACGTLYKEMPLQMMIFDEVLKGSPDVFGYDSEKKTLHILDYKTGDRLVLADNNYQLLTYGLLASETFKEWQINSVNVAILNTLSDRVFYKSYECLGILSILKDEISAALHKVKNEQLFGSKGPHCKFCPARNYCPLQRDLTNLKNYADMDTDELIINLKKRRKELAEREIAIKEGLEFSEKLTPLIKERLKRSWREDVDLPQGFFVMKQMSISEAEKMFGYREVVEYTISEKSKYIG